MSLVGRAKNSASYLHDAGGVLPGEKHEIAPLGKHSLKAVPKTEHLPSEFLR